MTALVIGLIFLTAFTVGVGVERLTAPPKSPGMVGVGYQGLSELGATEAHWKAQHMPDPRDANSSFLPQNLDGRDRFVNVNLDAGRVSGFIMQFDEKTLDETAAKVIARGELPPDANIVFDTRKYLGTTDIDEQCDLLQYQSAAIGTLLKQDRAGIVSVVVWSPGPQGLLRKYDPTSITSINVLTTGTLGVIPNEC